MDTEQNVASRVQVLRAVADPVRLAVVDALTLSDRSPSGLAEDLEVPANLLAHHLNVLSAAGVVRRVPSESDRRRSYVQLLPEALDGLLPGSPSPRTAERVVFVCTHNSARSQIAAAVWRTRSQVAVASAGTHPAARVHPRAVAVAQRHGTALAATRPVQVEGLLADPDLVVTVCDSAHEAMERTGRDHLHWSVPDPVRVDTDDAFEASYETLAGRVVRLAETVTHD